MSHGTQPDTTLPYPTPRAAQSASQMTAAGCLAKSGSRLPQSVDFVGNLTFILGHAPETNLRKTPIFLNRAAWNPREVLFFGEKSQGFYQFTA